MKVCLCLRLSSGFKRVVYKYVFYDAHKCAIKCDEMLEVEIMINILFKLIRLSSLLVSGFVLGNIAHHTADNFGPCPLRSVYLLMFPSRLRCDAPISINFPRYTFF